ncbi:MAG: ribonuclease J [Clostridiales bacterium]|jgi:ribonuclease J|nr:ribonuclease J [Clostridiales bacterium]
MAKTFKIVFLGGIGEIGKNMTAIEYSNDIIIIDAGMSFPGYNMPGIDYIIPDISYLKSNREKIRGVILTHGHEDHIGSLPYLIKDIPGIPVFGTRLTIALCQHKFRENKIPDNNLNVITEGDVINVGFFKIEFIKATHSIAGACHLAIETPIGMIFHTGDYKFDYTPIDGKMTDLGRLADLGNKGVVLMLGESTNIEKEGHSMSEKHVGQSLDYIFSQNLNKRLIIATFASNIYRIQQIIDLAVKYDRKVAFSGRSMINIAEMAFKIGELKFEHTDIVEIDKIKRYPHEKTVIICTGGQGEPMSALSRMSTGDFDKVVVNSKDTVVLSSSPIPGNEKMVLTVVNNLYRLGADVIYEALHEVHASGHAYVEELKLMMSLIKPKFFIPVHGEYRHLKKHSFMAQSLGIDKENIFVPEAGSTVIIQRSCIKQGPNVQAGNIYVDGYATGDMDSLVLKDRQHLAEDGFILVILNLLYLKPGNNDEFFAGLDVITRGFHSTDGFAAEVRDVVRSALSQFDFDHCDDNAAIKTIIKRALKKYIFNKYKQNPMIMPIVLDSVRE